MTLHVLDCTDCLSTLRIRDLACAIPLHCPRCGERLDPATAVPRVRNQKTGDKRRTAAPAATSAPNVTLTTASGRTQTGRGVVLSLVLVVCVFGVVGSGFWYGFRYLTSGMNNSITLASGNTSQNFTRPSQFQPPTIPGRPIGGRPPGFPRSVLPTSPPVNNPPTTTPPTFINPAPTLQTPARSAPTSPATTTPDVAETPNATPSTMPPGFGTVPGGPPAGMGRGRLPNFPRGPSFPTAGGPAGPGFRPPSGFPGLPGSPPSSQPGTNLANSQNPPTTSSTPTTPAPRAGLPTQATPLPELLKILQNTKGGQRSLPLRLLSSAEPTDELREQVLELIAEDLQEDNPFLRQTASAAFCRWAGPDRNAALLEFLQNKDPLLRDARIESLRTLARFNDPQHYPDLVVMLNEPTLQREVREALVGIGADIEQQLLSSWPQFTNPIAKRLLLEVVREVGTADCLPLLEQIAESPDFSIRPAARAALQAVNSRLQNNGNPAN